MPAIGAKPGRPWRVRTRLGRLSALIAVLSAGATSSWAHGEDAGLPVPLRLADAVAHARAHRSEIVAARGRSAAAAERPAIVSALDEPMISASLDHLPFMLHGADVSVSIEQRFPLSRLLSHRGRAAEADVVRVRAQGLNVELDIEFDATAAYLMLGERRETALVLGQQRSLAHQIVGAATARYASGSGSRAEALRAEIELARVEGASRSIVAELRASEVMLNTSLGRPAQLDVPALDITTSTAAPPGPERILTAALSARPELRAGGAEVDRAEAEIAAMKSMYWPMAMVRTGPAYTMSDGAGWMLMVGVSLPIWRDRLDAGVREAEAMTAMARADLQAMRRMVEGDALAAREQVIAARERFLVLRDEIVPRARELIEPTLNGYASGQLPLVSVLEAARSLWSAEGELVSARYELGLAWARLERATGTKGWGP